MPQGTEWLADRVSAPLLRRSHLSLHIPRRVAGGTADRVTAGDSIYWALTGLGPGQGEVIALASRNDRFTAETVSLRNGAVSALRNRGAYEGRTMSLGPSGLLVTSTTHGSATEHVHIVDAEGVERRLSDRCRAQASGTSTFAPIRSSFGTVESRSRAVCGPAAFPSVGLRALFAKNGRDREQVLIVIGLLIRRS